MYSSYIIARSASRIRCWITCFAVIAAMRPVAVLVTAGTPKKGSSAESFSLRA